MEKKNKNQNKKMKDIATALVLAVILWITLIFINDPEVTTTIMSVPVEFTGAETLRGKGLAVTGKSDIPALAVSVSGKRSDLIRYMDDVRIEVDFSSVDKEGKYEMQGATVLPSTRIKVEKERYSSIPVKVERIKEKKLPIQIETEGTNKENLIKSVPETEITISGAESEVVSAAYGIVKNDITNIQEDTQRSMPFIIMNENGMALEKNETIECSETEVVIKDYVYKAVNLPISVTLIGDAAKNYIIDSSKLNINPQSMEVGVRPGNDIKELYVEVSSTDVENREFRVKENEDIYIPNGNSSVKLKAEFIEKELQQVILNVSPRNLKAGLKAEAMPSVTAYIYGAKGNVSANTVKAWIDCTGLDAGTYTLPVIFEGSNIEPDGNYDVQVTIS